MSELSVVNTENKIVEISHKAIEELESIFKNDSEAKGKGLRLGVVGGGCSGMTYKMEYGFEKEKDNIQQYNSFKVFIDPKSSVYLKGVTLDFNDGLKGKGFVFVNPNAANTCGCGESFSV